MDAITVALINDYEVVVRGLASMLSRYRQTLRIVEMDLETHVDQRVDIGLYDTFAAPQGDRAEVRSLAADPRIAQLVVYSWNLDASLIERALEHGVAGYVSKSLPARDLVSALTSIHAGGRRVWGPDAAERTSPLIGEWPGREEGLPPREAEVLALITQGYTNQGIADRAHLSINTVKTYIRNCYRRIGVSSRSQAVLWGAEHGFSPDRGRINPSSENPPT